MPPQEVDPASAEGNQPIPEPLYILYPKHSTSYTRNRLHPIPETLQGLKPKPPNPRPCTLHQALSVLEVLDKPIICNRVKGHLRCLEEVVESRQSMTPAEIRKDVLTPPHILTPYIYIYIYHYIIYIRGRRRRRGICGARRRWSSRGSR